MSAAASTAPLPSPELPALGPVSASLERRVRAELTAGPILWLDKESAFDTFVDGLRERRAAGQFLAPVYALRGSYLELLLELSHEFGGPDAHPVLVHLPTHNKASIRGTPMLEVYESSKTLELSLETVVREAANGLVAAPEIEDFIRAASPLTLEAADHWLAARVNPSATGESWVSKLDADGVVHHFVAARGVDLSPSALAALTKRVHVLFGDRRPFRVDGPAEQTRTLADRIAESIAEWLLLVEFTRDLGREPRVLKHLAALPAATAERCIEQVVRLREQHPKRYRELARAVEPEARKEEPLSPEDLGKIDTFAFEEDAIFSGAIAALQNGDDEQARRWAERREKAGSVWLDEDRPRRWAWELIARAARFGAALTKANDLLAKAASLEEAISEYESLGASVDLAQRHFEQRFAELRGPELPRLSELTPAFDALRDRYVRWLDAVNVRFARLCAERGPLPSSEYQQRTVFEHAVLPLLEQDDRIAFFTLDAFRYEMAIELMAELGGALAAKPDQNQRLQLRARLAELPTLTSVGMNVLSPLANADGRLKPVVRNGVISGFRAGEWTVAAPEDRRRAMGVRLPTGRPPLLLSLKEDVCDAPAETLKRSVAQAKVVLVHGVDLDEAGESGFGVHLFERLLRDITTGIHNLQAAGVRHFVLTADHGFLLHDRAQAIPFDSEGVSRRHVYSSVERRMTGVLTVSLGDLGYEGDGFFLFPEDGSVFGQRARGPFLHGGNSLQERVIPVLSISRDRAPGKPAAAYRVMCEPGSPFLGVQCVRVRVALLAPEGQAPLRFASAAPVDLLLDVRGRADLHATLKEVRGAGASIHQQKLRLTAESDWALVYFTLEGAIDERVRLTLSSADSRVDVEPATAEALYEVAGKALGKPAATPTPAPILPTPVPVLGEVNEAERWAEGIPDEGGRRVLLHIDQHGSIAEEELIKLLGGARQARAFAQRLEGYRPLLPFDLRIDASGVRGKRYLKVKE